MPYFPENIKTVPELLVSQEKNVGLINKLFQAMGPSDVPPPILARAAATDSNLIDREAESEA